MNLPPLSVAQILAWADAHRMRTGGWPGVEGGRIVDAPSETWSGVNTALDKGQRGLPGGSSLACLLQRYRRVRNRMNLPRLSVAQILAWADAHFARMGTWPSWRSGPVVDAPGETWSALALALVHGHRGLPGGSSLPRLLAQERGVRNIASLPLLSVEEILASADAYHARTGHWPTAHSGPIPEAPGTTWLGVDKSLRRGRRGLPGDSSLARLLQQQRGTRRFSSAPEAWNEKVAEGVRKASA
jgi:hypothetical protein